ncbi:unnamed protein product [Prorocentrum cordatum]|uniref:Uncharacterized protein n=1 Tax=Prorocentrum cordatum TaxID=2364126 RepID=A0ABN9RLH1_9DINO|nr:unnamed protein product [Polarella glacialis]
MFNACCCNKELSESGGPLDLNDEYKPQEKDQEGHDSQPGTPTTTGARGGFWKFSEGVQNVVGAIQQQADHIVDGIQDQAAQVTNLLSHGVADALHLDDKFKAMADNVLDQMAPRAGELTIDEAQEFIPAFKRLDQATSRDFDGEATEACTNKILGYRSKIHDFCEDVVDCFADMASDPSTGVLNCLYRVISWIMRACKEGVQMAVDLLKKVIPDCIEPCCFSCLSLEGKLVGWVTATFNKVVDILEGVIQEALKSAGVPDWICDRVDFNGNASADRAQDDDEPVKVRKAREAAGEAAPPQMSIEAEGELAQAARRSVGCGSPSSAVEASDEGLPGRGLAPTAKSVPPPLRDGCPKTAIREGLCFTSRPRPARGGGGTPDPSLRRGEAEGPRALSAPRPPGTLGSARPRPVPPPPPTHSMLDYGLKSRRWTDLLP